MNEILISDFDGCILKEKAEEIEPEVAEILSEIDKIIPVVILTARTTEKSKNKANLILKQAGLGGLSIYYRDIEKFDHSQEGLINYKTSVLRELMKEKEIVAGIGDNFTDDLAYMQSKVKNVFRMLWTDSTPVHSSSIIIPVNNETFTLAWRSIKGEVERMKNENELTRTYKV